MIKLHLPPTSLPVDGWIEKEREIDTHKEGRRKGGGKGREGKRRKRGLANNVKFSVCHAIKNDQICREDRKTGPVIIRRKSNG